MDADTARRVLRARGLEMPKEFEREVAARGGAIRLRTVKRKGGRLFRVAIVRKKGPRGGQR